MKVLVSRFESVFKKALQAHVDAAGNTEGYQYVNSGTCLAETKALFTNGLTKIYFCVLSESSGKHVTHAWVDSFKVEGDANDIAHVSVALMTLKHLIIQALDDIRNGEYQ